MGLFGRLLLRRQTILRQLHVHLSNLCTTLVCLHGILRLSIWFLEREYIFDLTPRVELYTTKLGGLAALVWRSYDRYAHLHGSLFLFLLMTINIRARVWSVYIRGLEGTLVSFRIL